MYFWSLFLPILCHSCFLFFCQIIPWPLSALASAFAVLLISECKQKVAPRQNSCTHTTFDFFRVLEQGFTDHWSVMCCVPLM